jgi:hypothetical protein
MFDFSVLGEISKNAIQSIKKDKDGDPIQGWGIGIVFFILYYFIPILLSIICFFSNVFLSDMQGFLITGISIFTGLFFSLLLTIGSKVKSQKENENCDNISFKRYRENMKQITDIVLFVILLGVYIFIIILLNALLKNFYPFQIEMILTIVSIYLTAKFIILIFFMVQRFYHVSKEELNSII